MWTVPRASGLMWTGLSEKPEKGCGFAPAAVRSATLQAVMLNWMSGLASLGFASREAADVKMVRGELSRAERRYVRPSKIFCGMLLAKSLMVIGLVHLNISCVIEVVLKVFADRTEVDHRLDADGLEQLALPIPEKSKKLRRAEYAGGKDDLAPGPGLERGPVLLVDNAGGPAILRQHADTEASVTTRRFCRPRAGSR